MEGYTQNIIDQVVAALQNVRNGIFLFEAVNTEGFDEPLHIFAATKQALKYKDRIVHLYHDYYLLYLLGLDVV
jgi:hypothetical protein